MDSAHFSREISMALIFDIYPRAAGAKLGRKVRVTSGSAAFFADFQILSKLQ